MWLKKKHVDVKRWIRELCKDTEGAKRKQANTDTAGEIKFENKNKNENEEWDEISTQSLNEENDLLPNSYIMNMNG
jgi:hypothetical protein